MTGSITTLNDFRAAKASLDARQAEADRLERLTAQNDNQPCGSLMQEAARALPWMLWG